MLTASQIEPDELAEERSCRKALLDHDFPVFGDACSTARGNGALQRSMAAVDAVRDEDLDFDDDDEEEEDEGGPPKAQQHEQRASDRAQRDGERRSREHEAELDGEGSAPTSDSERIRQLLQRMSPEQQERYEYFMRSTLQPTAFRHAMEGVAAIPRDSRAGEVEDVALCARGAAKLFVGDLIESAVDVQHRHGADPGPLKPWHIREAFRLQSRSGKYPNMLGRCESIFTQ